MIRSSHVAEELRILACYGLAAVTLYFCIASVALRSRWNRGTRVARYEPPSGISPATAAYLVERGVSDKPFVVAIVNMAAKGYLRIEQGPTDYLISRSNGSVELEAEEQVIADGFFCGSASSVCLSALRNLERTARTVRGSLESAVEPDLLSDHFWFLIPGLTVSLWSFIAALYPEMQGLANSNGSTILIFPAFLAVWALLATIRTLPVIFYKLRSRLPGKTPRPLRFAKGDRTAPFMFLLAILCLGLISWATSPQLALLFGGFVTVNLVARMALRSPTAAGHELLRQIADFRMFFLAVDSDRVNRLNAPNASSAAPEKYWAWALALDGEHAWGEQFAAAVLNRLGPDAAMASIEANLPEEARASTEILDLHLR